MKKAKKRKICSICELNGPHKGLEDCVKGLKRAYTVAVKKLKLINVKQAICDTERAHKNMAQDQCLCSKCEPKWNSGESNTYNPNF